MAKRPQTTHPIEDVVLDLSVIALVVALVILGYVLFGYVFARPGRRVHTKALYICHGQPAHIMEEKSA